MCKRLVLSIYQSNVIDQCYKIGYKLLQSHTNRKRNMGAVTEPTQQEVSIGIANFGVLENPCVRFNPIENNHTNCTFLVIIRELLPPYQLIWRGLLYFSTIFLKKYPYLESYTLSICQYLWQMTLTITKTPIRINPDDISPHLHLLWLRNKTDWRQIRKKAECEVCSKLCRFSQSVVSDILFAFARMYCACTWESTMILKQYISWLWRIFIYSATSPLNYKRIVFGLRSVCPRICLYVCM